MVLMSEQEAARRNLPVMAQIVASANVGVDPAVMGIGPVNAVKKAVSIAVPGNLLDSLDVELSCYLAKKS